MEKSTHILTIIEYQKKALNVFNVSVILIDSVYRKDKDYYPQVFLEERKYVVKKRASKFITDDIEISSYDSDRENSDEENSNEEN